MRERPPLAVADRDSQQTSGFFDDLKIQKSTHLIKLLCLTFSVELIQQLTSIN